MSIQDLLDLLCHHDGAILYWQLPDNLVDIAVRAVVNNAVMYDEDFDLYVHPLAISVAPGAYTMPV